MQAGSLIAFALQAAAVPAPAGSIQQQFDQASAAAERKDFAGALAGYTALEHRLVAARNARSLPLVRLRLGATLVALGRGEEAAPLLRAGLDDMRGKPDPTAEQPAALLQLAAIEEVALDYGGARRDYAAAVAQLPAEAAAARLDGQSGIVRTAMFDDAPAALATTQEVQAQISSRPNATKTDRAIARTLRGRVLLNGGRFKEAGEELAKAVDELGGLTSRVNRADISARSDRAIAAMLAGDSETARKYLAWTGAGHADQDLPTAADHDLPACDGPEGLKPDDVAIVEFAIADDGSVSNVQPIYASRQGPIALAFARAVAGWSWTAAQMKSMKDPFFRQIVRLELRCSNAARRPEIAELLAGDTQAWLAARGIAYDAGSAATPAARAAAARAELVRRQAAAGGDALALVPVLLALATNPIVPADEAVAALARAQAIAEAADAPATTRAELALRLASARCAEGTANRKGKSCTDLSGTIAAIAADPVVRADPRATAAIALATAESVGRRGGDGRIELLRAAGDAKLAQTDPLRVGALVRLASAELDAGDVAAARAAFARSGLGAQECALVDAQPELTHNPASSSDFPEEAQRWGFDGWVVAEFDLTADGHTLNPRAVIAYPPFVFGTAANKITTRARYTQSYRPPGALGCGGAHHRLRFTAWKG